ncbi:hypothetical protein F5Y09DRAFT_262868 [Xylaria sp. FL1042]|nr:hypothetical protein F5Y09DRAFT_262868 [Xylaria sp. FL1042]
MISNQQTETCTVPVGTRLSYGIELELLVAYLCTGEADPDQSKSSTLAPILRVGRKDHVDAVKEHIRATLRDHGIRVQDAEPKPNDDVPPHLHELDKWAVTEDYSVYGGKEEWELCESKSSAYKWLGLELKSPACWDVAHAHEETVFVVNLLKSRYRTRVNPSCGFHVHVGNGPRYFDAKTLKRAGGFLWAADPMLSRLHAPWRRVGEFGMSIRYRSRLACRDRMRPADAKAIVDRTRVSNRTSDPMIPVVPWSDTSMEEDAFAIREEWEEWARERVQNGPFITLDVRPPSPQQNEQSSDQSSSSSPSPRYPSDDEGGVRGRRLLDVLSSSKFRVRCNEVFGHPDPLCLKLNEQHRLLATVFCEKMYQANIDEISPAQREKLFQVCAPYLRILQSSYQWDPITHTFVKHAKSDLPLHSPQPRHYTVGDNKPQDRKPCGGKPSLAVTRLLERVELQKGSGINGVPPSVDEESDSEESDSATINDLENAFYDRLYWFMDHPNFPLDLVEYLLDARHEEKVKWLHNTLMAEEKLKVLGEGLPDTPDPYDSSDDNFGFNPYIPQIVIKPPSTEASYTPVSRRRKSGNNGLLAPPPATSYRPVSRGRSGSNGRLGLRGGGGSDFTAIFPDPLSPR